MRKQDMKAQPGTKNSIDLSKDVIMIDPPTPTSASQSVHIDITGSTPVISKNTPASNNPKSSEVINLDEIP